MLLRMQKSSVCESRKALDAIDFNNLQFGSSPEVEYTLNKENPYESFDETELWNAFNEEIARISKPQRDELEDTRKRLDMTQEERDYAQQKLRAEQEVSRMLNEQMQNVMMESARYKEQFEMVRKKSMFEEQKAKDAREQIRALQNFLDGIENKYQRERLSNVDTESRNAMIVAENRKLYEENQRLNKKTMKLKKQTAKYQAIEKERDHFAMKLGKMKHDILAIQDDASLSKEHLNARNLMMAEEMEKLQQQLDVLSQSQLETCSNRSTVISLEEELFPNLQIDDEHTESDHGYNLPSGGFVMVKSQDSLETEDFMTEVDEPSSLAEPPPERPIRQIRSAPRARPKYHIPSDDILLKTLADKQRKFNLFSTILTKMKSTIRNVSRYDEIVQFLENAESELQVTRLSIPSLYPMPILIPQSAAEIIGRRR